MENLKGKAMDIIKDPSKLSVNSIKDEIIN